MNISYCTNCGVQAANQARFCTSCGESLNLQEGQAKKTFRNRYSIVGIILLFIISAVILVNRAQAAPEKTVEQF